MAKHPQQRNASYWTEMRKAIFVSLRDRGESLSELYEFAVETLYADEYVPGWSRLVAHSIREICNRLPDVFLQETIVRLKPEKDLPRILDLWRASHLDPNSALIQDFNHLDDLSLSDQTATLAVPIVTLEETRRLLIGWNASLEGASRKARKLLIELSSGTPQHIGTAEASIRGWTGIIKWSVSNAHSMRSDSEFSIEVYRKTFESFEGHLLSILSRFFDTLKYVDAALENLSIENLDQTLGLLLLPQHQNYFFNNLANPDVLERLVERGFFRDPPSRSFEREYCVWPALSYLAKVASVKPDLVSSLLEKLPDITNPYVCDSIAKVCVNLPPLQASKHVHRYIRWSKLSFYAELPALMRSILISLSTDQFKHHAFKVLREWLKLKLSDDLKHRAYLDERNIVAKIGSYSYEELLNHCIPVLLKLEALEALRQVVDVLHDAISTIDTANEIDEYDWTKAWWRDISKDFPEWNRSTLSYVAVFLRNQMIEAITSGLLTLPQLLDLLKVRDHKIFRRIEFFLIGRFPDLCAHSTRTVLVRTDFMLDSDVQTEYKYALQKAFSLLHSDEQENLLRAVNRGPDLTRYRNWQIHEASGGPTEDEERCYIDEWKSRWLKVMLKQSTTEIDNTVDDELELDEWIDDDPVFDFRNKNAEKIIQEIEAHNRVNIHHRSDYAIRDALSIATKEKPDVFVQSLKLLSKLEPYYLAAIVAEFSHYIDSAKQQNVEVNLLLILRNFCRATGRGAEDLKFEVIRLLNHRFKANCERLLIPKNRNLVWSIITRCEGNLTSAPRVSMGEREDFDLYNVSFNDFSSMVIECVIEFAKWQHQTSKRSNKRSVLPNRVRVLLNKALKRKNKVLNAVVAFHYTTLCILDKRWAMAIIPELFEPMNTTKSRGMTSFMVFLKWNSARTIVYNILRTKYQRCAEVLGAMRTDNGTSLAQDVVRSFAEHLVQLYASGSVKSDEMITLLPATALELRKVVLEVAGDMLEMAREDLSSEIQQRLMSLWELLFDPSLFSGAEIFSTWLQSRKLPLEWSLSVFQECLQNMQEWDMSSGNPGRLVSSLREAFVESPYVTLKCCLLVAQVVKLSWVPEQWTHDYKYVISSAKSSGDEEQVRLANDLLDILGNKGFLDFRDGD